MPVSKYRHDSISKPYMIKTKLLQATDLDVMSAVFGRSIFSDLELFCSPNFKDIPCNRQMSAHIVCATSGRMSIGKNSM